MVELYGKCAFSQEEYALGMEKKGQKGDIQVSEIELDQLNRVPFRRYLQITKKVK